MSELLDFLTEHPVDNLTEQVVVSPRLVKFPFTVKPMMGPDFANYQKLATGFSKNKKVEFNSKVFNEQIVLNHTVEPNFRDAAAIKKAGCITPEQFLYKVLLAGEIAELVKQITKLSGFDTDIEAVVQEAKNS